MSLITLTMALVLDPETETTKWDPSIINLIIYTCAFITRTCQNVHYEKRPITTKIRHKNSFMKTVVNKKI